MKWIPAVENIGSLCAAFLAPYGAKPPLAYRCGYAARRLGLPRAKNPRAYTATMFDRKYSLRFCSFLLCAFLLLAGCGTKTTETTEAPPPEVVVEDPRTPVIGARALDDGRKVGGSAKGKIGDTLTNVFFAFSVNDVAFVDEYEGGKPEKGYVYLAAKITVQSAFDEPITMWSSDFLIQWGDGDNDYGYPIAKTADAQAQMDDEYSLAVDESVTKTVVYEVPLHEGTNEYTISYQEYYEDDVEGNTFFITFTLEFS